MRLGRASQPADWKLENVPLLDRQGLGLQCEKIEKTMDALAVGETVKTDVKNELQRNKQRKNAVEQLKAEAEAMIAEAPPLKVVTDILPDSEA
jgi:hypothetical protein